MSVWRRKAIDFLPALKPLIERSENQMDLWIELQFEFLEFVKLNKENEIRNVLDFASWCISDSSGKLPNDTSTAAIVAFYEHLAHKNSHIKYFSKWFTRIEYLNLKDVFSYQLTEEEIISLNKVFKT